MAATDYAALFTTYLNRAREEAAQPADLLHLLTVALKSPDHWPEARDLLFPLNAQFESEGRFTEWRRFLDAALAASESAGDEETRPVLLLYLGNIHRIRGEHERALALLDEAAGAFAAQGDALRLAQAHIAAGRTLQQQHRLDDAEARARRALDILPPGAHNERAAAYRVLGGAAVDRNQWAAALAAFEESLALWRAGGDERFAAFGLANVGSALRGLERYRESESAITGAIATFARAGDGYNEAIARNMLGNLHLNRAEYDRAIEQYHRAERLLLRNNDRVRLAGVYNNWGMALAGLGQWERAIAAYEQSIEHWAAVGNPVNQANCMDNLGLAYTELGDHRRASATFRAALDILGDRAPTLRAEISEHLEG